MKSMKALMMLIAGGLALGCALTPAPVSFAGTFTEVLPADRLTDRAENAITVAPSWLRADLQDNFKRMQASYQDIYAEIILNPSQPRFRDEIAFCVANIGTANLEDPDFIPDLLEENAFYIYEHDQYLPYVRVQDTGDPDTDDEYYTTTFYLIEDNGSLVEYELPMEIYYWKIVHPKIEDEFAHYINPAAVGDVPAAPPTGVFWRDWLFTHTEEIPATRDMYPILRDTMSTVEALWGNTTTGAIGTLSQWARDTLAFSSGSERPHQPVRIYTLHMGRCGEWQDYTSAASRACLIPCQNVEAISEDHVWNEFWHLRWIHWEPVNGDGYIDNPLVYENGWGKVFSGVFAVDGDGFIYDVIDTYSEGFCTILATVLDANGDPVDGVRLTAKDAGYAGCYGYGGADGTAAVLYGDGLPANLKIQTELGKIPDGSATYEVSPLTEDGAIYTWTAQYATATLPVIPWTAVTATETSPFRLNVHYTVEEEIRTATYPFDKQNGYTRHFADGSVDVFIVDAANRALYEADQPFEAFELQTMSTTGDRTFVLPRYDIWTVVVTAERKITSEQVVNLHVVLETDPGTGDWTAIAETTRTVSLMPGDRYTASIGGGGRFGTDLRMSTTMLHPGETCWCNAIVYNPGLLVEGTDIPLFVILDVFGELFMAPDFNAFSYYTVFDLQVAEEQTFVVLPPFTWPTIIGSVDGLYWYAGMTNPEMTALFGDMDMITFGWEE
ncbi:hypothetical protein JXA80_14285 [bacterium]|nr:hypothetical protein [candidate division CSSED10-310 bacterium]